MSHTARPALLPARRTIARVGTALAGAALFVLTGCATQADVRTLATGGPQAAYELRGSYPEKLHAEARRLCGSGGYDTQREWARGVNYLGTSMNGDAQRWLGIAGDAVLGNERGAQLVVVCRLPGDAGAASRPAGATAPAAAPIPTAPAAAPIPTVTPGPETTADTTTPNTSPAGAASATAEPRPVSTAATAAPVEAPRPVHAATQLGPVATVPTANVAAKNQADASTTPTAPVATKATAAAGKAATAASLKTAAPASPSPASAR